MKKLIVVLCLLLALSGCTASSELNLSELGLSGEYYADTCVYLSLFISATPEYYTGLYQNQLRVSFDDEEIFYSGTGVAITVQSPISYRQVAKDIYIDSAINVNIDDLMNSFTSRYDIYENDVYAGLTVFKSDNQNYIAEIRMLDDNSGTYLIWSIFSIGEA